MRTIIFLVIIAIVGCRTASSDTSITIPSYTVAEKDPAAEDTARKAGDVEVFRLINKDTTYYARMYRNDNGSVRRYETSITGRKVYDRFTHQWVNDSTVSFQLIQPDEGKVRSFLLIGSGPTTIVKEN